MSSTTKFFISILSVGLSTAITTMALPLPKAVSQSSAYRAVERDEAYNNTVDVPVWAGRSSAIDFSETEETITYIGIADSSRAVYNTDANLETGQARTIFIRVIKPISFPNLTTTSITNLSVKTRTASGQIRLYTFNLVPSSNKPTSNGVLILKKNSTETEPTLTIGSNGKVATLNDIEQGLQIAIDEKYTAPDDPVVFKVREFLALTRNTTMTISSTASKTGVSLTMLTALGKLGQNHPTRFKAPNTIQRTSYPKPSGPPPTTPSPSVVATQPARISDKAPSIVRESVREQIVPKVAAQSSQRQTAPSSSPKYQLPPPTGLNQVSATPSTPDKTAISPQNYKIAANSTPVQPSLAKLIDDANAIAFGLLIANQKGHIKPRTTIWNNIQNVIIRLRRGESREDAARNAGIKMSVFNQLIAWGQKRP